jgi:glycosyltransferase involved in cell wall biosynthesis
MMGEDMKQTVLFFCEHTAIQAVRSGIQRVVIETARAMAGRCELRLVKWDKVDGQLRDLDSRDLENLLGDDASIFSPHPACHRVNFRFVDTVENPDSAWLLFPEISYFVEGGTQHFAAMRAQCHEAGIRSAAVFYDLIPVVESAYAAGKAVHLEYMIELVQCDRIFAISQFSADSLVEYFEKNVEMTNEQLADLRRRVISAPLGEFRECENWGLPLNPETALEGPRLVMVGTIEPRKQQVRLLKALNDSRSRYPALDALHVDLFGSLHPDDADGLHQEIRRNSRMSYHRYGSDQEIENAYCKAWFSAFVSTHEGYGLPIVESLRRGVPCLTSSFGAMAEVAAGGGCLTVDTLEDNEIVKGLVRLLTDVALLEKLKDDIALRPKRSWDAYAGQMLQEFADAAHLDREAEAAFSHFIRKFSDKPASGKPKHVTLHGISWTVSRQPEVDSVSGVDRQNGRSAALLIDPPVMDPTIMPYICQADILAFTHCDSRATIIDAAKKTDFSQLLPSYAAFGPDAVEQAIAAGISMSRERRSALALAAETDLRCRLLSRFKRELPEREHRLAIVLSTYNRGPFIEHNVQWILRQIDEESLPIRCVVVDNASTDDTIHRLHHFTHHPNFTLVQNANNVGMLGNLRVCGAGLFAPYCWVIGDDDFIVPGRIRAVLEVIDRHPGLPLMVHNFAVYHRAFFSPTDEASQFMNEQQVLAPQPRESGILPINVVAGEHDNLYTAIYPLVFRSDVLAACFNHPFTGAPFSNLTECVPTTKLLLGSYRYCNAFWFADVGIVGNAHNSWSSHRPRWHLVLMPMVLQLAHETGVDAQRVWAWLQIHKMLFMEAVDITIAKGETAHIEVPGDTFLAEWCFRETIPLDARLKLSPPRPIQDWNSNTRVKSR